MASPSEFSLVFEALRSILKPFAPKLNVTSDRPDVFYLEGMYNEKWKKKLFFASVQVRKNYVSFYLMPIYMFPDLLKNLSPELKKHMQGKSCFNFKKFERALFDELKQLVKQGFERFMKEEYS